MSQLFADQSYSPQTKFQSHFSMCFPHPVYRQQSAFSLVRFSSILAVYSSIPTTEKEQKVQHPKDNLASDTDIKRKKSLPCKAHRVLSNINWIILDHTRKETKTALLLSVYQLWWKSVPAEGTCCKVFTGWIVKQTYQRQISHFIPTSFREIPTKLIVM